MYTVSIQISFEAAHRLLHHPGKCQFLHGHSYVATLIFDSPTLNSLGMAEDFSFLRQLIRPWINEFWDHNILLHPKDPLMEVRSLTGGLSPVPDVFGGKRPYTLRCGENPTAENMAKELYGVVNSLLERRSVVDAIIKRHSPAMVLKSVTIQETRECSARYEPEEDCGGLANPHPEKVARHSA